MKLIDADRLKENIEGQYECDCCHGDDDDWSAGRASAWWAARAYVDEAPTIDAIPLDWLNYRISHAQKEGFKEAEQTFRWVRLCWEEQKEEWEKETGNVRLV